jgi:hypothetical protein
MAKTETWLTPSATRYAWQQLAQRAGFLDSSPHDDVLVATGIRGHYAPAETIPAGQPCVVVTPCAKGEWRSLLERQALTLDWLPARLAAPADSQLPFDDAIPILFWGESCKEQGRPFAERREDGSVVFYVDILATTFFMLSRWEETVLSERDEHDRFPAAASVAYKQGFLDRPIVDEYALILREWLKVLLPGWEPEPRVFSVKLSHDIDHLRRFPQASNALRTVAGDLVKRQDLRLALASSAEAIAQVVAPHRTGYARGIQLLADWSREYGLGNDAFYFIAAGPGPMDGEYDVASNVTRRIIGTLSAQGFEIGLHAGYHTLGNPEKLAEEKARLECVLGEADFGGRQHYLRFRVPDTWRHWQQVGLEYDATMGYADHEGFRCGTCHAFRPFDVEQNAELNIWELPLIAMDRTLSRYRDLSPEQAEARIYELARRCKQVEGTFTMLWHNSSLVGEWEPWSHVYRRSLRKLAEMKGAAVLSGCGS